MRLEGDVDTDMGGDVVALDRGRATVAPTTGERQVVGDLAADMHIRQVFLEIPSTSVL